MWSNSKIIQGLSILFGIPILCLAVSWLSWSKYRLVVSDRPCYWESNLIGKLGQDLEGCSLKTSYLQLRLVHELIWCTLCVIVLDAIAHTMFRYGLGHSLWQWEYAVGIRALGISVSVESLFPFNNGGSCVAYHKQYDPKWTTYFLQRHTIYTWEHLDGC